MTDSFLPADLSGFLLIEVDFDFVGDGFGDGILIVVTLFKFI
jgi:hypothetical protein